MCLQGSMRWREAVFLRWKDSYESEDKGGGVSALSVHGEHLAQVLPMCRQRSHPQRCQSEWSWVWLGLGFF